MPREGSSLSGKRWAIIFFIVLFGTASIMMLCREMFIPVFATGALRGLVGHDQTYYHSLAVVLAQEIHQKGWVAWTLRPDGQAPAAILGALYVFFGPDSRVVILINALLHAVGTMALYGIVVRYVSWKMGLFLCVPFWLSPYQMISLYSQPNKDSYAWAGALILIYGWMELAGHFQKAVPSMSRIWFRALFLVYAGATLMILVRPYLMPLVVLYGAGVLCWLLIQSVRDYKADGAMGSRDQAVKLVSVLILLLAILPLSKSDVENEKLENRLKYLKSLTTTTAWHRTAWLPESIDNKIAAIMIVHRGSFHDFLNDQLPDGEIVGANAREALIDLDHRFEDVADVIAYLPRAIQIGVFAPFPERWTLLKPSGSTLWSFSTWYPRPPVIGLRMFLAYIAYGFLLWGVIHFRNKQDLALVLCFSLTFTLYYAFAIPHVGALDRYRSPFFSLLVTMGFACAARCWTDQKAGVFRSAYTSPDVSGAASKE